MTLVIGDQAPDFSAPDQNGSLHHLKQYQGEWLFLYFYPKDNTPGCTREACQIRDHFTQISEYVSVIGVSTDSIASHNQFATKHALPYTLLSDEDKSIVKAYGIWGPKKFMGKEFLGTRRTSFLIDSNGNIAKIYEKVKPDTHAQEVLEDVMKLKE